MANFNGKKVIITGAGRGIGRALALELSRRGAVVIAVSRTASTLDSLKKESSNIVPVVCDVANLDELKSKVQPHLPVHALVNNAGTNQLQPFLDVTLKAFDEIFNINFKATYFLSQLVAKSMVENKMKGTILHVSSQASQTCLAEHSVYGCTKAAIDKLTKSMAFELGPQGIRVNTVNPTVVLTDLGMHWSDPVKAGPMLARIPLRKFADVDDIVNPMIFLLSDEAKMITGVCLPVDGGACAV